ncbi:secreted RxLR effector protein 161-like [Salvia splendens]|uniref:secreted RxLR effector protein 161-like n=1 Tax=Salvia splendens TaxID=180675 RepID=UPI001C2735CD|nr:secreted RxLR effector protein 161-like [Salvia splendens]
MAESKLTVEQSPKSDEERLEMQDIPYASVVGSVMYAMIGTRPDVAQAISCTSRYMSNHGREHWQALKWILRYLRGAGNMGILFNSTDYGMEDALIGYCDSDFAGSIDTRKSQSGYIFTMYGAAVSWKSGLQNVVALSTTEAEYISLTSAVKESSWLRGIANDFGVQQQVVSIGCDNNGALSLAKHQVFHERSKHIDVRLHFVREEVENGKQQSDDSPKQ